MLQEIIMYSVCFKDINSSAKLVDAFPNKDDIPKEGDRLCMGTFSNVCEVVSVTTIFDKKIRVLYKQV
jgi:hypothetical protein